MKVYKTIVSVLALACSMGLSAQTETDSLKTVADTVVARVDTTAIVDTQSQTSETPTITYSTTAKTYTVMEVKVKGAGTYDEKIVANYSGLYPGQKIKLPGKDFSNAIKRFWKQGLYSDVKIYATKIEGDKVWLEIAVKPRPRISSISYSGVKKKDQEEFDKSIGLSAGNQVSQNMLDRAAGIIKRNYESNGYQNADVKLSLTDDPEKEGYVIVNVDVDRKEKVKIYRINIDGNDSVPARKLKHAMKDTKEKHIIPNLFKSKKFVKSNYDADKINFINKYNEYGFRDAEIICDSVYQSPKKPERVDIYIKVNEGRRYYLRNVIWVGNTVYPEHLLNATLGMKKGDVYNKKLMNERLLEDEDAVSSLYLDNGYLFFNVEPVEVNIDGDSVDVEMRIYEGRQAVINNVVISGNEAIFEHVIRRELDTKPGQLFSKSNLQRSARELAASGHWDPEKLDIRPVPDPENGTVDIIYNLEQKRNDQVEMSFGYSQTGVNGTLGLKFTNFSLRNIFNKESYKPLPQGDGQQLSLSFTTSGRSYQCAAISFMEPWLGGKRPISFSTSLFFSNQTAISSRYEKDYNYLNGGMYGYNSYGTSDYYYDADPDRFIRTLGASVGIGKRLKWPDDYFSLYYEFGYRHYKFQDWEYFTLHNGHANNLRFGVTLSRNSIDNPYYTHRGSQVSLTLQATPPYSKFIKNEKVDELLVKKDAGTLSNEEAEKLKQDLFKWVEYYKTEFKAKLFTPLSANQKLVLMTRAEYGFLGYYDKNHRSPFERYYVGGDGTSGTSSTYALTTVTLRGYENGSLSPRERFYAGDNAQYAGNMYSKLSLELRYPLMLEQAATIYVLTFAEAGNAWQNFKDFNPMDLKRSAGAGVRIFLPMLGLLGVDYGYGFDKDINGNKGKHQFHIVIGQEF
ncbi:MAG: BamA/TamA family outer membrane protein [Bacteroidales bacterium]|nr:BamA/TamA family outer membrane protein [Candidatus Scybalocola fimicaballi]